MTIKYFLNTYNYNRYLRFYFRSCHKILYEKLRTSIIKSAYNKISNSFYGARIAIFSLKKIYSKNLFYETGTRDNAFNLYPIVEEKGFAIYWRCISLCVEHKIFTFAIITCASFHNSRSQKIIAKTCTFFFLAFSSFVTSLRILFIHFLEGKKRGR